MILEGFPNTRTVVGYMYNKNYIQSHKSLWLRILTRFILIFLGDQFFCIYTCLTKRNYDDYKVYIIFRLKL